MGGDIYSSTHGTYVVKGVIKERFDRDGGVFRYGFPIAEQYVDFDKGVCQRFEEGFVCNSVTVSLNVETTSFDMGDGDGIAHIARISPEQKSHFLYSVSLDDTKPLKDKISDYKIKGYKPIVAINGDYKDALQNPEGYNKDFLSGKEGTVK